MVANVCYYYYCCCCCCSDEGDDVCNDVVEVFVGVACLAVVILLYLMTPYQ